MLLSANANSIIARCHAVKRMANVYRYVVLHHSCTTWLCVHMVTSKKMPTAKMFSRQNSPGKVKMAPSLFTNDTSSFNNSTYHTIPIWFS